MNSEFWVNVRIIRLFISVPCIFFGCWIILANLVIFINNIIPGRKWSSAVPFFGGIFLALGILLIPFSLTIKYFWWVAFLLDYTLPMFVYFLFFTKEGREIWKSEKK